MLYALLIDHDALKKLQDKSDFTALMVRQEEYKTLPLGAVWNEYLKRQGVKRDYLSDILDHEKAVAKERKQR